MENSALIFIPDISGFTKFVTQTEIQHSNHIISELIEVILNANILNFEVSEIEGDAVLYFRKGKPPEPAELIGQAKRMFEDFHSYLKIIERDNVCQCGACQSASNLTLKFVAHYGDMKEVVIQNHKKIMGGDVILAHLLLKNNVPTREYLLMTENYLNVQPLEKSKLEDWVNLRDHLETYENFDRVTLKFIPFEKLREKIPEPPGKEEAGISSIGPGITVKIKAPILLVHEVLTDHESKYKWIKGLKNITSDSKINRVNTSHTCVFDNLEIHFITQQNKVANKEISYRETGEASVGVNFIQDFRLKEENEFTFLSVRIFPQKNIPDKTGSVKKIFKDIKTKMVLTVSKRQTKKNLQRFKEYCEKLAVERAR